MKTILYILILVIGTSSFAQDSQLFDNTWYLKNIIIEGQDNFPPNSLFYGNLDLTSESFSISHPYCEAGLVGNIIYNGNDEFNLSELIILIENCGDPEILLFIGKHYSIYMGHNPFFYIITANGNEKILTITNPDGDQAIYGNNPLAIPDFLGKDVSVFPNPAKDKLFLTSKNNSENLKVKILNIQGKLLSTQNVKSQNQNTIDISQLASGMYFLNIENKNGNTMTKKFIKE